MVWFNSLLTGLLPFLPRSLIALFARDYIAGENLIDAVSAVRCLNRENIGATIDILGEAPKNEDECQRTVELYQKTVDAICAHNLLSGISIKLSSMGIKLDPALGFENARLLVDYAARHRVFVRIDMEEASLKEATIKIYLALKKTYDNVGMVVQAYMRDGLRDADRIISHTARVRLCKGAYYWEDEQTVFKDMDIINASYVFLLEKLLTGGCVTAIATHDEKLVFKAMTLIDKYNIPKDQYEFQMLYGVGNKLRSFILNQGHPVRVYVPFGKEWFAYCVRRLKENPKIAGYIFLNALKKLSGGLRS